MLSMLFTPFYLPLVGILALLIFSYLSLLSWQYKLQVVIMTYLFTILLPTLLIHFYRRYNGWTLFQLRDRERRMVPYAIAIMCYGAGFYIMNVYRTPYYMTAVIVSALVVQGVCGLVNIWYKISTHTAAIGGICGGIIAHSLIMGFNPVWWLSCAILLAGAVGTARMMLRIHTLSEVCTGFLVGLIATFITIVIL